MRIISVILVCFIFLNACVNDSEKKEKYKEVNRGKKRINPRDTLHFDMDSLTNQTSKFIGGIKQEEKNVFSVAQERVFWKNYKTRTDVSWKQIESNRLFHMRNWQEDYFSTVVGDTLPLFYPFSGPDFMHAFILYPKSPVYVLFALEPIIPLPSIENLSEVNQKLFLSSVENALRDIYQKSYFITNHMSGDLKANSANGVIPIFYVFFARTGCELYQANEIRLDAKGKVVKKVKFEGDDKKSVKGMEFIIKKPGDSLFTTVYYFSQDISNSGLKKNPEIMYFLSEIKEFNTLVKSASYLMMYSTFSDIRNYIMTHTKSIFQDDTGIPYREFKNNKEWNITLFGEYTRPVKDFSDHTIQEDLDSAYQAIGWENTLKLPFRLGYHWFGDKRQNHQLFIKKDSL